MQAKDGDTAVDLRDPTALSTSNWALARALPGTLKTALAQPVVQGKLSETACAKIQGALTHIAAAQNAMPPALRFDTVDLKREQTNPDYEHLWFSVGKLSYGRHNIDNFEFRLGCGNVSPKRFGTHPKLEFPEGAGAGLFEKWFAESSDDFGDKYELRFALPDGMDLGVLKALSTEDQAALSALVGKLPAIVAQLEHTKLRRAMKDWQKMVSDVQRIHGMHTAPTNEAAA